MGVSVMSSFWPSMRSSACCRTSTYQSQTVTLDCRYVSAFSSMSRLLDSCPNMRIDSRSTETNLTLFGTDQYREYPTVTSRPYRRDFCTRSLGVKTLEATYYIDTCFHSESFTWSGTFSDNLAKLSVLSESFSKSFWYHRSFSMRWT